MATMLVVAPSALACSCVPRRPDHVAVRDYDAVFTGRVVDSAGPAFFGGSNGYALAVEEVIKGTVYEKQWIFSEPQGSACGMKLRNASRYIVFAYGDDASSLSVNSCSNTRRISGEPGLESAGTLVPGRSRGTPPDLLWAALTLFAGALAYRLGRKRADEQQFLTA